MNNIGQGVTQKWLGEKVIAICSKDKQVLSEFSLIFKKIGIAPCIFESLEDFWHESLKSGAPTLTIFDIRLMTQGNLILKDHPLVKVGKLPLSFVYSKDTEPLLFSTYEIFNLGLIKVSKHTTGQVKAVLKRLNSFTKLNEENIFLKKENDEKFLKLSKRVEKLGESDFFTRRLKDICSSFTVEADGSFIKSCAKIFENVEFIKGYSFYEIGSVSKKIDSPEFFNFKKFIKLPSLWGSNEGLDYINLATQKMSVQVASEIFDNDFVSLVVKDEMNRGQKIIFLSVNDKAWYSKFDFSFFEQFLDSYFLKFCVKNMKELNKMESQSLNFWSFLSLAEKQGTDNICVDFTIFLNSLVNDKSDNSLDWEDFIRDFIGEVKGNFKGVLKYTFESNIRVYFLTNEDKKEELFNILDDVITSFPYRRYCFNNDGDFISFEKPKLSFKSIGRDFIKNLNLKNRERKKPERVFKPSEFL